MLIVRGTSNGPEHDIGNYLGPCSRDQIGTRWWRYRDYMGAICCSYGDSMVFMVFAPHNGESNARAKVT